MGTLAATLCNLGYLYIASDTFDRIQPILPEDRSDTKLYQMFFVWFSANFNVLAYVLLCFT